MFRGPSFIVSTMQEETTPIFKRLWYDWTRASSSTLRKKNRKIGNILLENRNKIGIYEIKEEQNRNIGSLKQLILLIFNNYLIKYYNHCFDIGPVWYETSKL